MLKNNVRILSTEDYMPYIDYVKVKYGEDFLHNCKKEDVDESCKSDVFSVKNQAECKKDDVDDRVERSKLNWNEGIKTCHEGLERINTKGCHLEKSDADGTDDYTKKWHENSSN